MFSVHDGDPKPSLDELLAFQQELTEALHQENDPTKQTEILKSLGSNRRKVVELANLQPAHLPSDEQAPDEARSTTGSETPVTSGVINTRRNSRAKGKPSNPEDDASSDSQTRTESSQYTVVPQTAEPEEAASPVVTSAADRVFARRAIVALIAFSVVVILAWLVIT